MPRRSVILAAAVLAACGGGETGQSDARGPTRGPLTVAVVPKGTTHEFWKAIHAGAVQAQQELTAQGDTVSIIWKGPLREDDRELQVQVIEGFIAQKVSGIVLAPLDRNALVRPVEEARQAGVPTVIIDSGLETDSIVSFVATDNRRGGELAADRIGTLLANRGKVLLLRYAEGSASTTERELGFLDRMKANHPGIQVISSDQYAGPTRETAKRAAENLLNRYGADLSAIFTVNESSTIGMLLALTDIGRVGKIRLVGFDAGSVLIDALRKGQLDGIAVQNPMRMGYLGVKSMVDHLRGRPVERRIDTGVTMVTRENLDSAQVRDLVSPPVDRYLSGKP
jgi:ribose transport system substrate-binding protein